jgi:hypothetical protein
MVKMFLQLNLKKYYAHDLIVEIEPFTVWSFYGPSRLNIMPFINIPCRISGQPFSYSLHHPSSLSEMLLNRCNEPLTSTYPNIKRKLLFCDIPLLLLHFIFKIKRNNPIQFNLITYTVISKNVYVTY